MRRDPCTGTRVVGGQRPRAMDHERMAKIPRRSGTFPQTLTRFRQWMPERPLSAGKIRASRRDRDTGHMMRRTRMLVRMALTF
jgi:hypothetical protein